MERMSQQEWLSKSPVRSRGKGHLATFAPGRGGERGKPAAFKLSLTHSTQLQTRLAPLIDSFLADGAGAPSQGTTRWG